MIRKFFAFALIASSASFAASNEPACQGTAIAPEFRGTHEIQGGFLNGRLVEITADHAAFAGDGSAPAWTCEAEGVTAFVIHDVEHNSYTNYILVRSGQFTIMSDDFDRPTDAFRTLKKVSDRGGLALLKKIR